MGVEYKIYVDLKHEKKQQLQRMLTRQDTFSKQPEFDGRSQYEFRENKSEYEMPDFVIVIEDDGAYVCDYLNLKKPPIVRLLEQYFQAEELLYRTEEL